MKAVRIYIALLMVGLMNLSCIDTIDLDLDSGESHLVVFGWITNEVKAYEVKLTESNGYSDQTGYPAISGAEVFVTDQLGNRFDFTEASESGRYLSDPSVFVGSPGSSYELSIIYAGDLFRSSVEEMHALSEASEAFINFIADPEDFNVDPEDENFFVSAFIDDDPSVSNYYRWKVYVNDQLRNRPEELVLFDDEFTNGNKFKFDAGNVLFTQSDIPRLQHMSLSKGGYDYYKNVQAQISNSTLSPRVLPGIVEGNITNLNDPNELVLGYFGASEIADVVIDND